MMVLCRRAAPAVRTQQKPNSMPGRYVRATVQHDGLLAIGGRILFGTWSTTACGWRSGAGVDALVTGRIVQLAAPDQRTSRNAGGGRYRASVPQRGVVQVGQRLFVPTRPSTISLICDRNHGVDVRDAEHFVQRVKPLRRRRPRTRCVPDRARPVRLRCGSFGSGRRPTSRPRSAL